MKKSPTELRQMTRAKLVDYILEREMELKNEKRYFQVMCLDFNRRKQVYIQKLKELREKKSRRF